MCKMTEPSDRLPFEVLKIEMCEGNVSPEQGFSMTAASGCFSSKV